MKQVKVSLTDQEYREIQAAARRWRVTVAEWIRQALRKADREQTGTVEAKLQAVATAARNEFPTADVDVMLREIEAGRGLQSAGTCDGSLDDPER